MTRDAAARLWFAVTALAVVIALVIQVPITGAAADGAFFSTPTYRVLNLFVFFTIWSNILVAVVSVRLALRAGGRGTDSGGGLDHVVWRVARLAGLVAITVTFIVYNVALRGLAELGPSEAVADELLHTVVPLLTVIGWVVFGPRGATSWRVVGWTLVMPVGWAVFTLVRGEIVGSWYPYPFLDVTEVGYPTAVVNIALVGVVFVALAAVAHLTDRALVRRRRRPQGAAEDVSDRAST